MNIPPSLEMQIAAAVNDDDFPRLDSLLAEKSALADLADPSRVPARLRREADALDYQAERDAEYAAEYIGKAAYRRQQGSLELAADFQRMGEAGERVAARKHDEAFAKRLRAAELEAAAFTRAQLMGVVSEEMV